MVSETRRPIGLVIFDCDGVLIDSEIISATTLVAELQRFELPVDLDFVLRHFLGRSYATMVTGILKEFGFQLPETFEDAYRTRLLAAFDETLQIIPGVREVIDALAVPCCVATSSSPARAMRSLEIVRLDGVFKDRLFTASAVKNGKPAPDLFLLAAEKMGCQPDQCLVIEDSLPGVQAARAAGMTVWHFSGGSHLRGHAERLPGKVPADRQFDSFNDFFDGSLVLRTPVPRKLPD